MSKQWVNEAIAAGACEHMRVHEGVLHGYACPVCGKAVVKRRQVIVDDGSGEQLDYAGRLRTPWSHDETLTFACGTKRTRKDGVVRVVARCLSVKEES